jgi:hypothetical protein
MALRTDWLHQDVLTYGPDPASYDLVPAPQPSAERSVTS